MIGFFIVVAVCVIVLGWVIGSYNSLIELKVRAENSWSDIDIQLKRRYDVIPNLVATVQGYAAHEKGTLEKVIQARASAMNASGVAQKGEAENFLSGTLKSLFALSENYPNLKANENFSKLQTTLVEIEDTIQNARRYYNAVVRDFNTNVQTFPTNVLANMFHFQTREFFQLDTPAVERQVPSVKF